MGCRLLKFQITTLSFLAFDRFFFPDRTRIVDRVVVVARTLVLSGCGLWCLFSLAFPVWLHGVVFARAVSLVIPSDSPWEVASE